MGFTQLYFLTSDDFDIFLIGELLYLYSSTYVGSWLSFASFSWSCPFKSCSSLGSYQAPSVDEALGQDHIDLASSAPLPFQFKLDYSSASDWSSQKIAFWNAKLMFVSPGIFGVLFL